MMLTESERILLGNALTDWRWKCVDLGYFRPFTDEFDAAYTRHWSILWGTLPGNGRLW